MFLEVGVEILRCFAGPRALMAKFSAVENCKMIHQVGRRICPMGYQYTGVTLFFEGAELALKNHRGARVEARVGFVQEESGGLVYGCPCQSQTLFHAPGKCIYFLILAVQKTRLGKGSLNAVVAIWQIIKAGEKKKVLSGTQVIVKKEIMR